MPTITRQQLTLFVNPIDAENIEQLRERFNPAQHALIAAHVTLCREDEITQISNLKEVLQNLKATPNTIYFEKAIRFDQGKGVMLPAADQNTPFHDLRKLLLTPFMKQIRLHQPHITLMHPRNSTCNDEIFNEILSIQLSNQFRFDCISLIQQMDGKKWELVQSVDLK